MKVFSLQKVGPKPGGIMRKRNAIATGMHFSNHSCKFSIQIQCQRPVW